MHQLLIGPFGKCAGLDRVRRIVDRLHGAGRSLFSRPPEGWCLAGRLVPISYHDCVADCDGAGRMPIEVAVRLILAADGRRPAEWRYLDPDDTIAVEADELDGLGRCAINPFFVRHVPFLLADFLLWLAESVRHHFAVHADQCLVIKNSRLQLGRECIRISFDWTFDTEVDDGLDQRTDLISVNIWNELVEDERQTGAGRLLPVILYDRIGVVGTGTDRNVAQDVVLLLRPAIEIKDDAVLEDTKVCDHDAVAGFSGAFVVNGSPTQTAMVESSGAQSQMAQLATACIVALVLLFLTRPLQYLPHCVLGALVFVIAIRLIKLRTILELRRESPGELALSLTTAAVVVAAGVERGILLAMILSLLRIVHHSYHPHTSVLVPNSQGSWDMLSVASGVVTEPGLVMYRFGAELFYANANRFAEELTCLAGAAPSRVRWLIVDAEAMTRMDYSAARVVAELDRNLRNRGVQLGFARASSGLKSDMKRHHVTEIIQPSMIFERLHDALAAFEKSAPV